MKKKIYKFINNDSKYVPLIANELVNTFKKEANQENVDYSFTIDGETKQIKENNANTYFFFDTTEDSILHKFKKALFDEDLKNIEEDSKEEEILMNNVRSFLMKICNLMTKKHKKSLQETIRKIILGGKYNEKTVPLNCIEVVSIDIADYSSILESYKYLLRIGKETGAEINTDEVIKFIQDRQEKTGMGINDIFIIEKKAGNPLFTEVISVEQARKFLNEIYIYFYVDYSIKTEKEVESESKT